MSRRSATNDHRRPIRFVAGGFFVAACVGTVLLSLPISAASGQFTSPLSALFTATSAVCVTGLTVLDTESHWSVFGDVVILGLIQVGGLGVMTLATVIGMMISTRVGIRMGLTVMTETKRTGLGDLRTIVLSILRTSVAVELSIAAVLSARFIFGYGMPVGRGIWFGIFHAISAFNNAGFGLWSDSLIRYAADPWIIGPITAGLVIGGLGFPVLLELSRHVRRSGRYSSPRALSLHTVVTVIAYTAIAVIGVLAIVAMEWTNARTLGPMSVVDKFIAGGFQGMTVRTAGFNSVNIADLRTQSLLTSDVLMFIGGGSAGTAGGIKVGTFAVIAAVMWTEFRGDQSVHVLRRRLSSSVQRQALSIALLAVGIVFSSTLALSIMTEYPLDQLLFEVTSAFATVGLTTGITPALPADGQLLLIVLMYLGRIGPISLAWSLTLRSTRRAYDYPEDRIIVG